jgi:hypothetical protein
VREEVSTADDGDSVRKADGGAMLPEELTSSPGEGISAWLVIPQVGKVPSGAPVGKDVEEAQELPVNPTRGRHDAGQKSVGSARSVGVGVTIPRHLGARRLLQEPVDIRVAQLTVAPHVREMVAAELVCARTASTIACRRSSRLASLMTRSALPALPLGFCTEGICGAQWTGPSC